MTIREIARLLDAEILCGHDRLDADVGGVCGCDLMSDVLAFTHSGGFLLTGLTNPQVVRTAEMSELDGICFVRGKRPPTETLQLAVEKHLPLLACGLSLYAACGLLHGADVLGCSTNDAQTQSQ